MHHQDITEQIIGAALRVHIALGPGLLESAYREFLFHELVKGQWFVEKEKPMPVYYDGLKLNHWYRIDLVVDQKVVVEVKTVEALHPVHHQQVLTYLRLGNFSTGLLINFQTAILKEGIKRISNSRTTPALLPNSHNS